MVECAVFFLTRMKKSVAPLSLLSLLLAACGAAPPAATLEQHLRNPLYAEQYWSDMTQLMVDLLTNDETTTKDPARRKLVDGLRLRALAKIQEQMKTRRDGMLGNFVPVKHDARGLALLAEDTLYLSPDFSVFPTPSQQLYITAAVDPRDAPFPDDTSKELGRLESPYGAQAYRVPPQDKGEPPYRTVVIWDTKLERIFGFAQLNE